MLFSDVFHRPLSLPQEWVVLQTYVVVVVMACCVVRVEGQRGEYKCLVRNTKKVVVWLVKKRSGNLPPLDAVGDVRHDNFWFVVGRQSYSIGKTGNSHSCEWCHFTDGLFGERLQHVGWMDKFGMSLGKVEDFGLCPPSCIVIL